MLRVSEDERICKQRFETKLSAELQLPDLCGRPSSVV
jgi:hypothetical protein